jgi:dihydrofolate synthase/folylpolyglutamate synthase
VTGPRAARTPGADRAGDAERWLLSLELFGMRFGLDRMRRLITGRTRPPHAVHVVGTNGKSSTTRMIEALLRHHGVRTGAYLSPHLRSFAERIRVDGEDIGEARFAQALADVRRDVERVERTLADGDRVTQFEALTAAALLVMGEERVDTAVVEAGLGGRWDATNVLDAEVVVLTNVGLEHTRWLGPTVTDIAREKLAVVRPGAVLVVGPDLHPDAAAEAEAVAARLGARLVRAPAEPSPDGLTLRARGAFQRRNFAVACTAAEALLGELRPDAVRTAAATTLVPGRFEIVGDAPEVVLDGAHNPGGIAALAGALEGFLAGRPLVAVLSVLDDKDAGEMLRTLLPLCARVVLTSNSNPRALSPATLASLACQLAPDVPAELEADPGRALARARDLAGPGGVVLATGSIYLIGDLSVPGP